MPNIYERIQFAFMECIRGRENNLPKMITQNNEKSEFIGSQPT